MFSVEAPVLVSVNGLIWLTRHVITAYVHWTIFTVWIFARVEQSRNPMKKQVANDLTGSVNNSMNVITCLDERASSIERTTE